MVLDNIAAPLVLQMLHICAAFVALYQISHKKWVYLWCAIAAYFLYIAFPIWKQNFDISFLGQCSGMSKELCCCSAVCVLWTVTYYRYYWHQPMVANIFTVPMVPAPQDTVYRTLLHVLMCPANVDYEHIWAHTMQSVGLLIKTFFYVLFGLLKG